MEMGILVIIRIFKVSTKQMFVFKNKTEFFWFVKQVVGKPIFYNETIPQLIKHLPVEEYCQIERRR